RSPLISRRGNSRTLPRVPSARRVSAAILHRLATFTAYVFHCLRPSNVAAHRCLEPDMPTPKRPKSSTSSKPAKPASRATRQPAGTTGGDLPVSRTTTSGPAAPALSPHSPDDLAAKVAGTDELAARMGFNAHKAAEY